VSPRCHSRLPLPQSGRGDIGDKSFEINAKSQWRLERGEGLYV
jgi:hypothetical protein